jgi:hypothetical protein
VRKNDGFLCMHCSRKENRQWTRLDDEDDVVPNQDMANGVADARTMPFGRAAIGARDTEHACLSTYGVNLEHIELHQREIML